MSILSVALSLTAGFCIGIGIIFLFLGLRQKRINKTYLSFAMFALAYGATALGSMARFNAATLEQYINYALWGVPAFCLTYIFLIWFVAIYSKIRARLFLGVMTVVFLFIAFRLPEEMGEIFFNTLPWGEQITMSQAVGNTWLLFWITTPIVSGFILYACIRQYRRGEHGEALALGSGFLFLSIAIIFDIFVDMGAIQFFYISDFGFLPLAFVMSLQLSNKMMVIQDELGQYQQKLKVMVDERTAELKVANEQLLIEIGERERVERDLNISTRTARALLDAPSDSAILIRPDGEILDINQVGAERLGLELERARGRNVFDVIDPQVADFRRERVENLVATQLPVQWEDQRGGFYFDNRLYPIIDDGGQVASIAIFGRDITELKRAEYQLRQRIEDLNLINQVSHVLTKTVGLTQALQRVSEVLTQYFDTRYTHVIVYAVESEKLMVLTGFDREEGFFEQTDLDISLNAVPLTGQVLREGKSLVVSDLDSIPLDATIKEFLTKRNLQGVLLVPLQVSGAVIGLLVLGSDQTERIFTPDDVTLAETISGDIAFIVENARLQEQEMAAVASEERTRLARDLHDAVTQTIYSASLIAEVLPAVWERDPQEGRRNLVKLRQLVRGALGEMRTMLFELRPAALEAADLSTLLGHLSDALTGRTRIPVEVDVGGAAALPKDVRVALYRITQEAFNNIAKHSEATRVEVKLRSDPGQVNLIISDNGRGFDPEMVPEDKLGLRIMQERAEEVGAVLDVHSEHGQGTRVSVGWTGETVEGSSS
ncbi:MAG: histidine kinase [Anaerolineales bacterium]|nr:histidine kinase [Anaerolineales bacterium]